MRWTKLSSRASIVLLLLSFGCLIITSISFAASGYWPTQSWRQSVPEQQGMNSETLADMMELLQRQKLAIDSITIIRNGYMVLDAYNHPFKQNTKHIIHSCTKSITSTLVGIAIDKGYIKDVNQPVLTIFPDLTPDESNAHKQAMTIEHLLMMATGLKCQDSYLYGWRGLWEMHQSADWVQYMLDLPMMEVPGTRFEYCNGATFLLSAIIQKTTGMKTLDFAKKHLFGPLGIKDVKWRSNPQGIDFGYGDMWLNPHDMAKIGWLFLKKGRWADRQIISEKWVKVATKKHISSTIFEGYGYQWWVDPFGFYVAVGFRGQFIFVLPAHNLVVVFTSDLEGENFYLPRTLLTQYIVPAIASSGALKPAPSQTARLNSIIDSCATGPTQGYIWLSEEEGRAKEGTFVRTASPAFQFTYPVGSKKKPIDAPKLVMVMTKPAGVRISAGFYDMPESMRLEDMAPKHFTELLTTVGSDIKVLSHRSMQLRDGTSAYRTDVQWTWQYRMPLVTQLLSVLKDGKCIYLGATAVIKSPEMEEIVESVTVN